MQFGEFPAPRHVVAHLSDPHLLAAGVQLYDAIDPDEHLRRMLDHLGRLDPPPQALVFTGDLTDRGDPEAYRRLRTMVESTAVRLGAELVWVMGNHDERAAYAKELLDSETDGPQDRVHEVDGLRIIALDTTVPGYHHGDVRPEQLDWLREVLSTPAEHGTLLAMHHPPVPSPMVEVTEIIALLDQQRLAPVLAGTDVRGLLGGHFHFSTYSTFAGIPVSVASASCYTMDLAPLGRIVAGVDAHQAFTMMHLYADRIVHTVVPVGDAPEVTGASASALAEIAAMTVEQRRERFSRKT